MTNPFTAIGNGIHKVKKRFTNWRRNKNRAKNEAKQKSDVRAKAALNKAGYAYYQYIWRLNEKKATSTEQKRKMLARFLESYSQDLLAVQDDILGDEDPLIPGIGEANIENERRANGEPTFKARLENYMKEKDIKHPEMAVAMMLDFAVMTTPERIQSATVQGTPALKESEGLQTDLFEKDSFSYGPQTEEEKDYKNAARDPNSFLNNKVTDKQKQGIRDITAWLYRNSQKRALISRIKRIETMGHRNRLPFVDEIAKLTDREKLLIFFLVEKGREKFCTKVDVYVSQDYVPNPGKFKAQMQASKARFVLWLFTGGYMKWGLLSSAILKCRESYSLLKNYNSEILERHGNAEEEDGVGIPNFNNAILQGVENEAQQVDQQEANPGEVNDIINDQNAVDQANQENNQGENQPENQNGEEQGNNQANNQNVVNPGIENGEAEANNAETIFINGFRLYRRLSAQLQKYQANKDDEEKRRQARATIEGLLAYFANKNLNYIGAVDDYAKEMLAASRNGHDTNFFKWSWKRHRQVRRFRKNLAKMRKEVVFDGNWDDNNIEDLVAYAEKSLNMMKHASDFNKMIYEADDSASADKNESNFKKVDKFLSIWTFTGGILGPALANAGTIVDTAKGFLSKPVEVATDAPTPWGAAEDATQAAMKDPFAWCETAGKVNTALGIAKGAVKFSSGVYHLDHARKSDKVLEEAQKKIDDRNKKEGTFKLETEKKETSDNAKFVSDIINLKHQKNRDEKHQGGMNVAYGVLGMLSGVLTLSGVGAPIAKACDLISYALMGLDMIIGKVVNKKKRIALIDRYLGIDDKMLNKDESSYFKTGYHNELRHMLEAKCGAHNDDAMLNIIAWKYGNFLHSLCFVKRQPENGKRWITKQERDSDRPLPGETDGDKNVRDGATMMLENMFGGNIYSPDGTEPPKVTVNMIRAKFQF